MAGTIVANTLNTDTVGGVFTTLNAITGIPNAWVNFSSSTNTPTIKASYNVSSITGTATGLYTINFTNALPSANYTMAGSCSQSSTSTTNFSTVSIASATNLGTPITKTTTACQIVTSGFGGNFATIGDISATFVGG
jgi:hypothetical protein